ncbi:sensor histidine kinase [Paenibacillus mesophilus]|nr:sensor histidine kinase [Paenibacillus mesophilus]
MERTWRGSIRSRIFFSILLFLIIPFLLTFYYIDKPLENAIERKIGDAAREALSQVNFNVELFLEDMLRSAVDLSMNSSVNALLKNPGQFDEYEKLRIKDNVFNKLFSSYFNTEPYIALTDLHGNWLSSFYMDQSLYREYTGSEWYAEMLKRPFQTRWSVHIKTYPYADDSLITLTKTVTDLQTKQNIGMILFSVAEQDVRKYLAKLDGEVYMADEAGTVVSSPAARLIGFNVREEPHMEEVMRNSRGQITTVRGGEKWIVNYDTVGQAGWKIVQLIRYDTVFREIFDIRKVNIMIVSVIFLVFMFITLSISYSISRPLKLLNKRMQEVEDNGFRSSLSVSGPQEISTLLGTYNKMLKQIRELLQRLKDEYEQKEHMRFRALQAQINPHFLLNTINNIKWMAYIRHDREVGEMLSSLGSIMEASIGRDGIFIPLKQEINYIEHYIALMKLKYNEKLSIVYDVPEELLGCRVLKFMLQPIVENSIIHGIDPVGRQGEIAIRAWSENAALHVSVTDNGIGIRKDRLEQVRQWLERPSPEEGPPHRIGIKNVHDRIRLQHGERYGLQIDSVWNEGTRVSVTLPIVAGEENDYAD